MPSNRTPLKIMSEEHKMTKQDKLILTTTLAAIFFGIFFWKEKNMARQIPGLAFVLIGIFIILLG